MELRLVRRWFTDVATEGEWLDENGGHLCFNLEDRARRAAEPKVPGRTAIPCGRYRLAWTLSARFKKFTLQLMDVPEFTGIRVHAGNRSLDTKGCQIPGLERTDPTDDWIGQSRLAVSKLEALVVPRLRAGEEAWVEVVEEREIDERAA